MWAVVVEVDTPRSDQLAGMAEVVEQVLVQTFIAHSPVEAFHKSVLGLSRFCAAPSARLGHLAFECDRAFPTQC